MQAVELKPGIYWVGAKDWHVRDFHGYKTHRGTTYNAYLIVDEKVVLIDTVKADFAGEMLERIRSVIDPSKIDIIISNHVEMDHSGAIADVLKVAPKAEVYTSPVGEGGLKKHYQAPWNFKVVKTGSTLNIGKRNLQFVQVPFVHWPDSMVTYLVEDKILFSNDAFGQHLASDGVFDCEPPTCEVFEEAAKYYANIVYPYAQQVEKAMEALKPLAIDLIAPSHGVVWREHIGAILKEYGRWVKQENDGSALLVYDSMWNSTAKLAQVVGSHFESKGVAVKYCSLKTDHISDVLTHVLSARYIAFGTPVLNDGPMPNMAALLSYLKGLKPKNKIAFAFGSYGWNNKLYKDMDETFRQMEWQVPVAAQSVKYVPTPEELAVFAKAVEGL